MGPDSPVKGGPVMGSPPKWMNNVQETLDHRLEEGHYKPAPPYPDRQNTLPQYNTTEQLWRIIQIPFYGWHWTKLVIWNLWIWVSEGWQCQFLSLVSWQKILENESKRKAILSSRYSSYRMTVSLKTGPVVCVSITFFSLYILTISLHMKYSWGYLVPNVLKRWYQTVRQFIQACTLLCKCCGSCMRMCAMKRISLAQSLLRRPWYHTGAFQMNETAQASETDL